jgi:hypothetical protein
MSLYGIDRAKLKRSAIEKIVVICVETHAGAELQGQRPQGFRDS